MSPLTAVKTVTITTPEGDEVDVDLTLEFDYTPAERGSRENGIQMEPDYPESMELLSATTPDGVDVLSQLTQAQIEELEIDMAEVFNEEPEYDEPDYEPDYDYIGPD